MEEKMMEEKMMETDAYRRELLVDTVNLHITQVAYSYQTLRCCNSEHNTQHPDINSSALVASFTFRDSPIFSRIEADKILWKCEQYSEPIAQKCWWLKRMQGRNSRREMARSLESSVKIEEDVIKHLDFAELAVRAPLDFTDYNDEYGRCGFRAYLCPSTRFCSRINDDGMRDHIMLPQNAIYFSLNCEQGISDVTLSREAVKRVRRVLFAFQSELMEREGR